MLRFKYNTVLWPIRNLGVATFGICLVLWTLHNPRLDNAKLVIGIVAGAILTVLGSLEREPSVKGATRDTSDPPEEGGEHE